jgi:hypothetical protein
VGEMADGMVSGELCQQCCCPIDGEATGYPRDCKDCGGKVPSASGKKWCPECGKRVKAAGMQDHLNDVHNIDWYILQ